jgi:hypothetical protein
MKTILKFYAEYAMLALIIILSGMLFHQIGKLAESRSATHPEVERAAWEMFAGREGK